MKEIYKDFYWAEYEGTNTILEVSTETFVSMFTYDDFDDTFFQLTEDINFFTI